MKKLLATVCLTLTSCISQASVGLLTLGTANPNPVTVFYPSDSPAANVQRGPFTLQVAANASPIVGNRRLVVFSHGSGGSPWPMADFAGTLVDAGFIVAIAQHEGDNHKDQGKVGPETWKLRVMLGWHRAFTAKPCRPRVQVALTFPTCRMQHTAH